ncbi:hypothetical protein CL634_00695 [bacterium]|nr:hypothetical protein [bacterium]
MATLTGKKPSETYKDLLQISNSNNGVDTTQRALSDGEGTATVLELSTTAVNVDTSSGGQFKLGGTAITSTAVELNYTDGVTSSIQTQLNNKQDKITGVPNEFRVGGSSAGSVENKSVSEVKTILSLGSAADLDKGSSTDNVMQWGENSSADGFAQVSSAKIISKTSSQTRSLLGLGTNDRPTFGGITITDAFNAGSIQLTRLANPLAVNGTNANKLFQWYTVSGTAPNYSYVEYLSMIVKDDAAGVGYIRKDIFTNAWTGGSS